MIIKSLYKYTSLPDNVDKKKDDCGKDFGGFVVASHTAE